MTPSAALPVPSDSPAGRDEPSLLAAVVRLRALVALVVVLCVFGLAAPNFLSLASLLITLKHISTIAILGVGMTFVILTGGIDLSVGSIAGLAGMVVGALILKGVPIGALGVAIYPSVPVVVLLVLLVGAGAGLINGVLVARFGVASFIATLGMLYVARGYALLLSNGATFANLAGSAAHGNQGFGWLGAGRVLGVPAPVTIMALLAAAAAFVATRTPFGRRVYAIGGNARAAALAGVRVVRVTVWVYVISGVCAALVGMVVASDLLAAHPASGEAFELSAIAAVVLGGASLSGGRGAIGGTIVGACVIGALGDGMVMMGVSEFWQMVIKGVVIIAAVLLDRAQARLAGDR